VGVTTLGEGVTDDMVVLIGKKGLELGPLCGPEHSQWEPTGGNGFLGARQQDGRPCWHPAFVNEFPRNTPHRTRGKTCLNQISFGDVAWICGHFKERKQETTASDVPNQINGKNLVPE